MKKNDQRSRTRFLAKYGGLFLYDIDMEKRYSTDDQLSSISRNPFSTETLTESPVVTELNVIGEGRPRAIQSGAHTQIIIDGRKSIIQSDIITHLITDHSQMSLKGDYFPFHKRRRRRSCSHLLLKPS